MALNTQHFKDGLNKVGTTLRTSTEHEKVIEKAKTQLLSLFGDDNAGLESHEDVEKALNTMGKIIESKEIHARREDMKTKWNEMKKFVSSTKTSYNDKNFHNRKYKDNTLNKELIDKVQSLYKKIQSLSSQGSLEKKKSLSIPLQEKKPETSQKISFQDLLGSIDEKNITKKDNLGVEYVLSKQGNQYFAAIADGSGQADPISTEELEKQFAYQEKQEKTITLNTSGLSQQQTDRSTIKKGEISGTGTSGLWTGSQENIEDIDYEDVTQEKENNDDLNTLLIQTKFLRELLDLEDKIDKNKDRETKEQLKREYQQLRTNRDSLSSRIKESIKKPQSDTEHALKKVNDRIVEKLYATSPEQKLLPAAKEIKLLGAPAIKEDSNQKDITPNLGKVLQPLQKEIFDVFSIDANLMDKKNLVYESERNRIREKSEREYESANWFKKAQMFGLDRRNQRRDLKNSIAEKDDNNNSFIESGDLQARIEGNIGTYDKQDAMNIAGRNIEQEKSELGTDARINNIAHLYLTGDISQTDAITRFNLAFADLYETREDIQSLGSMTGTDLMAKLNNPASKRTYRMRQAIIGAINDPITTNITPDKYQAIQNQYTVYLAQAGEKNEILTSEMVSAEFERMKTDKIVDSIDKINENTANIKVKLRGITKIPGTEELEGVRYDNLDKSFVAGLSKITSKLGLPGNIAAKIALGGAITLAGGAPLFALVGVTGLGMILQYLKTYRDSTREIAKTHEDAVNLGMNELQDRISNLETSVSDAGKFAKVGAWFGWNALHRYKKQKDILLALQEMRNSDGLISVDTLISNLTTSQGHNKSAVLASTLARIDAGHDLDTQFISTTRTNGSGYGREQTAIKRNELMESMKQIALTTPLTRMGVYDETGRPESIAVSINSTQEQRAKYRDEIKQINTYTSTYNHLENIYDQVQSDIKTTRKKLSGQASGNYLKNVAAAAIVTGGVKVGRDALQGNSSTEVLAGVPGSSTHQEAAQHANFKLSGYDIKAGDPSLTNQGSLTDGTHVQNMQAEVSVDAVAAKAGSFAEYTTKIHDVQSYINSAGLEPTTTKALQHALSEDSIKNIIKIGSDASADVGNQNLLVLRWTEMVEKTAEYLKDNNLTNVKIDKVEFVDMANNMSIQKSIVGGVADTAHRGFEVVLQGTHVTDGTPAEYSFNRPNPLLYTANFPFSNTYAKTGKKQAIEEVPLSSDSKKTSRQEKKKSKRNLFDYSREKKKNEGNEAKKAA